MANQELLGLLKNEGVNDWNKWRNSHRWDGNNQDPIIDLSDADLSNLDLDEVDLSYSYLSGALVGPIFPVDLSRVNFSGTSLYGANLVRANLSGANLRGARLGSANLRDADLNNADLTNAHFGQTILGGINLNHVLGLKETQHFSPSFISASLLQLTKGNLPVEFLRGIGLSDWEIASVRLHDPTLTNHEIAETLYKVHDLRAQRPLQISPLFISYSQLDNDFVDKLENSLNEKGVRFWRDVRNLTSGRLEKQIDRAIRQNPTVLLVLSENSVKSDWVQYEVRRAREVEKELGRDVLCPVALDDSWKASPFPQRIMEQVMEYNILDFSKWGEDKMFMDMFGKLIDGLNLFYKNK